MYYSGIDQHKRDCLITTYDHGGQRVKQQRVPNDRQRLRAYFAAFAGPHRAVVESTGFWYWLADLLEELGVELTLARNHLSVLPRVMINQGAENLRIAAVFASDRPGAYLRPCPFHPRSPHRSTLLAHPPAIRSHRCCRTRR